MKATDWNIQFPARAEVVNVNRKTADAHTYEVWLGLDSSVGIATRYGLDGLGIEFL
jgi:hypothetical protein